MPHLFVKFNSSLNLFVTISKVVDNLLPAETPQMDRDFHAATFKLFKVGRFVSHSKFFSVGFIHPSNDLNITVSKTNILKPFQVSAEPQ